MKPTLLLVFALAACLTIAEATGTGCSDSRNRGSDSMCRCDGSGWGTRGSCKGAPSSSTSKCDASRNLVFNGAGDCACKSGYYKDSRGNCQPCKAGNTAPACNPPPQCPSGHKDAGSGKCTCDSTIPADKRTAKDTCKCTLGQAGSGGCGDPHFVGGNGVRYDFHGVPEKTFCLISDKAFHLNAHFIGQDGLETGQDGTWMDQLGFIFTTGGKQHSLSVALVSEEDFANQVSDLFTITYDSKPVLVSLPKSGENVWTSEDGSLTVVRGTEASQVELTLDGHFRTTLTASAHEFPDGHHIDFDVDELNITNSAHGVLGQTFQPERLAIVAGSSDKHMDETDVVEGSDHDYITSNLMAADCKFARFAAPSFIALTRRLLGSAAVEEPLFPHSLKCNSDAGYVSCLI